MFEFRRWRWWWFSLWEGRSRSRTCARATLWFSIFLRQVKREKVRCVHVLCEYMINWFTLFAVMSATQHNKDKETSDTLTRLNKEACSIRSSQRIQDRQDQNRANFVEIVDSSSSGEIEEISPSKYIPLLLGPFNCRSVLIKYN